jgi:hypothetical protein
MHTGSLRLPTLQACSRPVFIRSPEAVLITCFNPRWSGSRGHSLQPSRRYPHLTRSLLPPSTRIQPGCQFGKGHVLEPKVAEHRRGGGNQDMELRVNRHHRSRKSRVIFRHTLQEFLGKAMPMMRKYNYKMVYKDVRSHDRRMRPHQVTSMEDG